MISKSETINDVVCGYIGNIYSRGDCYEDEKALHNLEVTMELIECQMAGIVDEYNSTKNAFEGSRVKSHNLCKAYLESMMNAIKRMFDNE